MKRKVKKVLECTAACFALVIALIYLSGLLERKDSIAKNQPFYDEKEDFDVLFVGSSHVMCGISPMELWNEYGAISYNLGESGQQLALSYWVLENALDYTTPRLVVVDGYLLSNEAKTSENFTRVQESLDSMPISWKKMCMTEDLLDDPEMEKRAESNDSIHLEERTAVQLLWKFSAYHTRWAELSQNDFKVMMETGKGYDLRSKIGTAAEVPKIPASQKLERDTVSVKYLVKLVEACQSRGIEVLLIYLPFQADETGQEEANRLYDMASELGVRYINFLNNDVVDYQTDLSDNGHLNASGASKVTEYLGEYIMAHYDIPDQRDNPAYADWDEDYREYRDFKADTLRAQKSLDNYLMLAADKNYNTIIEWDSSVILQDEMRRNLLADLGVDAEKVTDATGFITIKEAGAAVDYAEEIYAPREAVAGSQPDTRELWDGEKELLTPLGTFRAVPAEDGGYTVYRDGKEFYAVSAQQNAASDIRIIVCDKETMQIVDRAEFTISTQAARQ